MSYQCAQCGKASEKPMGCPKCKSLGLEPVYFCSQECFKEAWPSHKKVHKAAKAAAKKKKLLAKQQAQQQREMILAMASALGAGGGGGGLGMDQNTFGGDSRFDGYSFTGPLRPWRVTPQKKVDDTIHKPDYADTSIPVSEQAQDRRSLGTIAHTAEETEAMRRACKVGREVLEIAGRAVKVGVSGDDIDRIIHRETLARDCYPSPLNYYRFPKSVCVSPNEVICHGIPDKRPFEDGDIINLDVTVYTREGFHADLNETFLVGDVDADSLRLVECAYECLRAAISMCKPGALYRDIGPTIDAVAREYRCGVNRTYCGHGIGRLFHTNPNVPHYAGNKAKGVMAVGHTFTIEPMVTLGKWKDVSWPDNWTAVTVDGKRSAQFEHTMVVTETGVEILTARPGWPTDRLDAWDRSAWQRPGKDEARKLLEEETRALDTDNITVRDLNGPAAPGSTKAEREAAMRALGVDPKSRAFGHGWAGVEEEAAAAAAAAN